MKVGDFLPVSARWAARISSLAALNAAYCLCSVAVLH